MFDWLGPLISGGVSAYGQYQANKTNVDIANKQMDFQERMSSSAYQRAMEDMKKAGLNPLLAYQRGGASTPAGAGTKVEDVLGKGVASALEYKRLLEEIKETKSRTLLNTAMARMQGYEADMVEPEADIMHKMGKLGVLLKWLAHGAGNVARHAVGAK